MAVITSARTRMASSVRVASWLSGIDMAGLVLESGWRRRHGLPPRATGRGTGRVGDGEPGASVGADFGAGGAIDADLDRIDHGLAALHRRAGLVDDDRHGRRARFRAIGRIEAGAEILRTIAQRVRVLYPVGPDRVARRPDLAA